MNVLVTGGAGFIGSHLVEALVRECPAGAFVRVLDNLAKGNRANLGAVRDRIEFLEGDVCDDGARAEALRGVEVVFHLAAIPSVPLSIEDPAGAHRNGTHATLLLLDGARRAKVRRVVFASSSAIYGDGDGAGDRARAEDLPPMPLSPYAVTKLAGELYAAVFARCYDLDAVSLRYFNVFGPRQDPHSPYSGVISRFCLACRDGLPLEIYGDGEQSRDFVYVENVVQANLAAARSRQPLAGQAFNIGTGRGTTLNELVRALAALNGKALSPRYLAARAGDIRHSFADIARARAALAYRPVVELEEGLRRTWAWYAATRPSPG